VTGLNAASDTEGVENSSGRVSHYSSTIDPRPEVLEVGHEVGHDEVNAVPEAFELALDAVGQEPDAVVAVSDAVKDGLDKIERESAGSHAEKIGRSVGKSWSRANIVLDQKVR
jgi:hypothetical protein